MAIVFHFLGWMFIILSVILILENTDSPNFKGFLAVSCWTAFLGVFSIVVGYIIG